MKAVIVDDELASLAAFLPYIADNERINCKLFRNDPLAAVEYVKNENVSVAFLDIRMPKIGGVELARRMIAANGGISIVIVTGYEQDEVRLRAALGDNLAEIIYKPFGGERVAEIFRRLAEATVPELHIRTFGSFDLFVDGRAVDFPSAKAKELLALLVDANGSYVDMDTAVGNLWADKNAELGKRLYRDAVCRLRMTLNKVGAASLVRFERARAVINTSAATCELWDLLNGKGELSGCYMPQYGWATEREAYIIGKLKINN
ncbi:MAG: response regulator [Clostridia bacterium]|nr:response regulator [Clostridia bacterium]